MASRGSQRKGAKGSTQNTKKLPLKPVILESDSEEEEVLEDLDLDSRIEKAMEKVMNKFKISFKKEIQKQMNEIEKSMNYYGEKIEECLGDLNRVVEKQNKLEKENDGLKKELHKVKGELEDLQQYTRNRNIQIDGVPEVHDEDLTEVVVDIGKKINVPIVHQEIDKVHRIPSRNAQNPAPIVVQFTTRQTRDKIINNVKKTKITTKDVKRSGEEKIVYVNEHLTKNKKEIMYEARRLKQEKGYKFLWVRDGKILMRKNETAKVMELRSFDDLTRIV